LPRTRSKSKPRRSTRRGSSATSTPRPRAASAAKGALEAIAVEAPEVASDLRAPAALLSELPERLRDRQPAFAETGGLHATGLFDSKGELLCLREDVGRHNAMDKVIGWAFGEQRLPLADAILSA
jgi:FdhD protein